MSHFPAPEVVHVLQSAAHTTKKRQREHCVTIKSYSFPYIALLSNNTNRIYRQTEQFN